MTNDMITTTEHLFRQNFFADDFDPDGKEVHLDQAQALMSRYPWNDIITLWHEYLYKNCHTPEEVINFANLYFYYGGADGYNPEPYKFLGYLFYHVDMDKYYNEAYDTFEAIALHILEYQCLVDLKDDPFYSPIKDPNILKAIDMWKHLKY